MSSGSSSTTAPSAVARALEFGVQFLSRHKAAAVVVTAYMSLLMRFWSDVAPAPNEQGLNVQLSKEALSDPYKVEPLDRAEMLARAKSLPMSAGSGSSKQGTKRVTLRREMSGNSRVKSNSSASELIHEDPVLVLRQFLESQTSHGSQSKISADDLQNAWQALSNLYAARGQHKEASEARKSAAQYIVESPEPMDREFAAEIADVDFLDDEFAGDAAGFVSLLQTGASYRDRLNSVPSAAVADAEAEVYKWLDTFGQSSMLDSCSA
eukprot:TRINITY_DN33253_c0_g1_i1.p1 TRINITY_DN33253_c0_g1~~TRINITY_DN33253_c0_g1_i1.p1  ORF type:complete len:266 (+),score=61.01 TRINITY_DN33253_c0_g1_i1:76-873(+)